MKSLNEKGGFPHWAWISHIVLFTLPMFFNHLRNLANPLVWESVQPKGSLKLSSFWLNQPLWKICERQIGFHFPKQVGVKIPKILGKPPLLIMVCSMVVLLMEEILHHLGCIKPCKYSNGKNYLPTGAGLLPSTVCHKSTVQPLGFWRRPRIFLGSGLLRTSDGPGTLTTWPKMQIPRTKATNLNLQILEYSSSPRHSNFCFSRALKMSHTLGYIIGYIYMYIYIYYCFEHTF